MYEPLATKGLSDGDVGNIVAAYLRSVLSECTPGKPLSQNASLILTMFKHHKRPCQVADSKTRCPYGSDPESCNYPNGCYTTDVLLQFAESRSLLP